MWPPRRLREIRGFLGIRRGHSLHPSFGVSPRHTDRGAIADDGILGSREPLESWLNCDCYRGASRVNQRDAVHEIPTPYFLTPRGGRWWVSGPPSLKLYSSNHGTLLYRRLCGPSLELDYVALRQQCNAPNGLLSAVCRHRQTRYRSNADDAVSFKKFRDLGGRDFSGDERALRRETSERLHQGNSSWGFDLVASRRRKPG